LSAVCMEDGEWSPDPSQVVCQMVTTTMPPAPTPTQTGREKITVALEGRNLLGLEALPSLSLAAQELISAHWGLYMTN